MKLLCALFFALLIPAASAETESPVTFHLPFETMDFMEEDLLGRFGKETPENRQLSLTEGRFGQALLMNAPNVELDEDGHDPLILDMITRVTVKGRRKQENVPYQEPYQWGTGRIHPAYGSISFWVKGKHTPCTLFEQTTTSWGRTERQLIEIHLERDRSISAFVEDSRYVQHKVRSLAAWSDTDWNHIVFMWDRSSGVELWVNNTKAASTMETDAWWDNQKVGLFRLPMSGALYDELYTFDRPLTSQEIQELYQNNNPPEDGDVIRYDRSTVKRLKEAFSTDLSRMLTIRPNDEEMLIFKKITPVRIHDEGVAGWWLDDGRYESAWPHEYGIYTDTPGDVDFHAEKADLVLPPGETVNYMTIEGNLDGATVLTGDGSGTFSPTPVITVPEGMGFLHGALIEEVRDGILRLPFTKEYGVPPGFKSDILKLSLTGDLRIHEAGLFYVSNKMMVSLPGDQTLYVNPQAPDIEGSRYETALKGLLPSIDRASAGIYGNAGIGKSSVITIPPMKRLNLFSESAYGKKCINTIFFDLWVTSPAENNVLTVKLTNPALPAQTWTHAEVRLDGFSGKPSRLKLALEFDPVFLMPGDRIWLQLLATDGLSIITCDNNRPATIVFRPELDWPGAEQKYSFKSMLPNRTTYSGMFEWMFWRYTKKVPDVDNPEHFGGPFDMVYPWQAVLKVNPGDRIANIYRYYATGNYGSSGRLRDMSQTVSKTYKPLSNAPDWAVYFRELQRFRWKIITWWRHNQRSDGQVGGGWNDDTLVFSRGYSDLPLDSNHDALILYNNVFDGFDKTNYFRDGYCRIWPIDDWHNGDFVRERYKSLVYNLGDPRSAVWAMEEAWHWDKPEKTPVNFGDGKAFLFGKDILEWYWNKRRHDKPYELTAENREKLIPIIQKGAELVNDVTLWRFTEARVHTDDQSPHGSYYMHDMLNGGWSIPPRTFRPDATITVGVGWIEGGGPELGRLVEYSGYDGLRVEMYSFDAFDRDVVMRLFRLDNGEYSVTLSADQNGDGDYETVVSEEKKHIKRFDRLTILIPSKVPVRLDISQMKTDPDPGPLPDLAVSDFHSEYDQTTLTAAIYNIGCSQSGPFTVTVLDPKGKVLALKKMDSLPGSEDFVPKRIDAVFRRLPERSEYTVIIDRKDDVKEIFEENNSALVRK